MLVAPETKLGRRHEQALCWDLCAACDTESSSNEEFGTAQHNPGTPSTHLSVEDDRPKLCEACLASQNPGIPSSIARKMLELLPVESHRSLHLTCRAWSRAVGSLNLLNRPVANLIPAEILLQAFVMLSPRDFDNARRTCSQWMRISLNEGLLASMLKKAGWWNSWLRDCREQCPRNIDTGAESVVWRMSRRLATECILSGRQMNAERTGFVTTTFVDFSQLLQWGFSKESLNPHSNEMSMSMFHASNCGNYLMATSASSICIYSLLPRGSSELKSSTAESPQKTDIVLVATVVCPTWIVSATIYSSSSELVMAASLSDRTGFICNLVPCHDRSEPASTRYFDDHRFLPMKVMSQHCFKNLGSAGDPSRSVSICPDRRCVGFGSEAGVQLYWFDEKTEEYRERKIPLSQPSDVLHFLSSRPEDAPTELRLISSLAGPGGSGFEFHRAGIYDSHQACPDHRVTDKESFVRSAPNASVNLNVIRATHCHHYRAVPLEDGFHILFIEPRTNLLCIGPDAQLGGPPSLMKALACIPPLEEGSLGPGNGGAVPNVFAAGSDLDWGLRIVAVYNNQLVLYSVPLDVYNVIRQEREGPSDSVMGDSDLARDWFIENQISPKRGESLVQAQNGDWDFLLSTSYRPTTMMWPFKIYGKEIGRMDDVVELALQTSHGGARVWAFSASGRAQIIDVDTFTSSARPAASIPCQLLSIGLDGEVSSPELIDRSEPVSRSTQYPRTWEHDGSGARFRGKRFGTHRLYQDLHDKKGPGEFSHPPQAANKRTSFSACIVDFNIPESNAQDEY
ncbi:uncharacterized protein KD926_010884 [Aspergillus affinis]|uniref:uncharacterized protein n=1 Tax=Aspergillus affinis TaxID=1070780 RepID=UPI0022FDDA84|nr:uncharacterized protein KD926_010884 [Aspergillus affinis]KAI9038348.1 hypothetical protein KD926_010884 [Aspergillus affinis]